MGLFSRLGLWPSLFSWTVGGRAARHARRNIPPKDGGRHFIERGRALDDVKLALADVVRRQAHATGSPAPGAEPAGATAREAPPRTAPTPDDFDGTALPPLRTLLESHEPSVPFTPQQLVIVAQTLSDVAATLHEHAASSKTPAQMRLSHYEAELINIQESRIDRLYGRWQGRKNALEARATEAKHRLAESLKEYTALEDRHKAKGFRWPQRTLPVAAYWPVMILLGIVEYPLNAVAFRILRDSDKLTYVLAALPAIVIVLLAHLIGTKIKQWPDRPLWRYMAVTALAVFGLCVGLGGIAALRADYLSTSEGRAVDLVQAAALLAVNFLVLAGGIVAAYAAHDQDAELEAICTAKSRLRRKLDRLWKAWSRAASQFDAERGVAIAEVDYLRSDVRASLDEYRLYNGMYRDDPATVPDSFAFPITDLLFKPRSFQFELDLPPLTLDQTLELIERRAQEAARAAEPSPAPDLEPTTRAGTAPVPVPVATGSRRPSAEREGVR